MEIKIIELFSAKDGFDWQILTKVGVSKGVILNNGAFVFRFSYKLVGTTVLEQKLRLIKVLFKQLGKVLCFPLFLLLLELC